jgi:membrane protein implicated in regulation of membrane protease activity
MRQYLMFQLPGWLGMALLMAIIWTWLEWSLWIVLGIFALWVAKDFAIYPFVRDAFQPSTATGVEELVGRTGITRDALAPMGYVAVRGELWKAEVAPGHPTIPSAHSVRVQSVHGLTLVVTADHHHESPPARSGSGENPL